MWPCLTCLFPQQHGASSRYGPQDIEGCCEQPTVGDSQTWGFKMGLINLNIKKICYKIE